MRFSNKLIKINLCSQYSQTCIQLSLFQQKGKDYRRQVTVYLRLVNPDCQLRSIMIRVLLLPKGNSFENMTVALIIMLQCICADLQLIN